VQCLIAVVMPPEWQELHSLELQRRKLEEELAALQRKLQDLERDQQAAATTAAEQLGKLKDELRRALQAEATVQEKLKGVEQQALEEKNAVEKVLEQWRLKVVATQKLLEEEQQAAAAEGQKWEVARSVLQGDVTTARNVSGCSAGTYALGSM
jgi:predicted  nucleic acid-binding Zn-ribbon protein